MQEIYEIQSMIACKVLWNSLLLIRLCITLGLNVLGKSGAGKEFTEVRPQKKSMIIQYSATGQWA